MRTVVVSHPAVTPINQDFFARVHRHLGGEMAIVLPTAWRNEYGRQTARRWSGYTGDLIALPVIGSGNIPLHVYRSSLLKHFKRLRPDVLYVHHEAYGAATLQAARAATIAGIPFGFYSAQNLVKRRPLPFSASQRYVYRRAKFAAAVSAEVVETLVATGYRGRAEVLALSVDTGAFVPGPMSQTTKVRFGYVGRIAPEKGVEHLLDALSRTASDIEVIIVGEGPDRQRLTTRADQLGLGPRVSWRGYVPHDAMVPVYQEMDVLVVPSRTVSGWKEQFGRVVIEALACGVPVLTSDSGELPKLVSRTGGGWTFPEANVAALAQAITSIAKDPTSRVARGRTGRARVVEDYDVDAMAARFAETLTDAAKQ